MKLIFQMACILCPECNFIHGYFRCQLPVEMVDVEVKVKTMQGIHTFRRDRTSQVIKCNPWSTKFHPYPSLIQKMKTYLELEGRLGPKSRPQPQTQLQQTCLQQNKTQPAQPSTNPMVRKSPGPKANVPDKRRRTMIAKRKVQGEGTSPAYTFNPNLNCSCPHCSHCQHPDTNSKVHSRFYTGDSI